MSIMIIIAILVSSLLIILSYIISHRKAYPETLGINNIQNERKSQYECGLEPFEMELGKETRERFYIKFYVIGILFLIFDLETILLYPVSMLFYSIPNVLDTIKSFIVLIIFLSILLLGLLYEYRKSF